MESAKREHEETHRRELAKRVSEEELERYKETKKAAKEEKIEEAVEEDQTGTDPRVFNNKWMPF